MEKAPAGEVRKTLTVVFSDLVGSTALQESLDPESVRHVMSRFYAAMQGAIERHDGHVEKFVGDAVMGVFGVPAVREDDALRAARAALDMVGALDALNVELERGWGVRLGMRTGVNTGEVVVGAAGFLVGDPINVAARLEQAATSGQVLIGEATARLVRRQMVLEPVAPLAAKGKSEAIVAYALVGSAGATTAGAARVEAPLVGRRSELRTLRDLFTQVTSERRCRLATIIGSPGLGKTRLARELAEGLAVEASVVEGRCEPQGAGITFLPIADVLRDAAGIGESDTTQDVRAKLGQVVEGDADADRIVERDAGVLGLVPPASAEETFWAVRRTLESLARRRPLLVLLDDIHWGQPQFLDLIEHLVQWVVDAPVLIVALARPELREHHDALTRARGPTSVASVVVDLEPLAGDQSRALMSALVGAELPELVASRVLDTTGGNPLFLGETVRMLLEDGVLRRRDDGTIEADPSGVDVPPTIAALLEARIERLGADERSVVERAAVIGKQFYRGAVAELAPAPVASRVDAHLEALRLKEMVEPEGTYWIDEPVYRFHHVLIRDAAYRALLKEARSELHERFARWLEEKAGELVGEQEEVIAFHLEQAHEYRRELGPLDERGRALGEEAAARLGSAGRRALARDDLAAATNLLSRALRRLEAAQVAVRAELLLDLAEARLASGDTVAAEEVVGQLRMLAGEDPRLMARAGVLTGQLATLTGAGHVQETVDAVRAAAGALASAGDRAGEAKAHHVAAQAQALLGQVAAVEESLDRALAAARAADDRRRVTAVLAAAPRAALWGPSPVVRASGRCLDVVRILRMTPGNRHVEAIALRCQAVLEAMRGRTDAARDILAAGRATLEELGLSLELHETAIHAGIVELLAGDPVAAEAHLRGAVDGFAGLGVDLGAAQASALLARALEEQGRHDEAITATEAAERHGGDDLKTTIAWCGVRAEALARGGDGDAALALAQRAVDLAEPTDALPDKADAWMALATVHAVAGRAADAREAAGHARELYAAKEHAIGVLRVTTVAGGSDERRREPQPPAAGMPIADPELAAFFTGFAELWARRDVAAITDAYPHQLLGVDHRRAGWGDVRGRAGVERQVRSVLAISPDIRFCIDEVLAAGAGAVALRVAWRGRSSDTGGELESALGWVARVEDGRMTSLDFYEPDDRDGMLARYAALCGTQPGGKPSERWVAEHCAAWTARDVERISALAAEDIVQVDHRVVSHEIVQGREAWERYTRSIAEPPAQLRLEVTEPIASTDDVVAGVYTFHGRGVAAGSFEISFASVVKVAGGRATRIDLFDPTDRDGILARFAESTDVMPAPHRFFVEISAGDVAAHVPRIPELYVEDFVMVDHRPMGWPRTRGHDALQRAIPAVLETWPNLTATVGDVLACDERVIAFRWTWHGTAAAAAGGGPGAIDLGVVAVLEDGRLLSMDFYEPGDGRAMLMRYAELGGGLGALGDEAPARVVAAYTRAVAAREIDAFSAELGDGFVLRDHRALGWGEPSGRDAFAKLDESGDVATRDIHFEVDEVLACDERVIAFVGTFHGTSIDSGGAWALQIGFVNHRDGIDLYEPGDRVAILARYTELTGERPALRVMGDYVRRVNAHACASPVERWLAEQRAAHAARDLDRLSALVSDGRASVIEMFDAGDRDAIVRCFEQRAAPPQREPERLLAAYVEIFGRDPALLGDLVSDDHHLVDHRAVGWDELHDREALVAMQRSGVENTPDMRFRLDEVIGCDDHVIALRGAWHGEGSHGSDAWEIPAGIVWMVRDGRFAEMDVYEPGDRAAVVARYADQGGGLSRLGNAGVERWWREWARRLAARDLEGLMELYADDCVQVDHRAIGWETLDHAGERAMLASALAVTTDLHAVVDEVHARDDEVIAMSVTIRATSADGGGQADFSYGTVIVVADGLGRRADNFEHGDRDAMLACYHERGGRLPGALGDRPAERLFGEYLRLCNAHDVDGLISLVARDFAYADHRTIALGDVHGAEAFRQWGAGLLDTVPDLRCEVDEVLASDDDVIAVRVTYRGSSDGLGIADAERSNIEVWLVDDGRLARTDQYDADARQAAVACFVGHGGGLHALGDRPPERAQVEYIRRYVARDLDRLMELFPDDHVTIDHRGVGWGELSREGVADTIRSIWGGTSDDRPDVIEVLACDERVMAYRTVYRGTGRADLGGGPYTFPVGTVSVVEAGHFVRSELFDPDDREAMLARFDELSGLRAPQRVFAEYARRMAAGHREGAIALYAPDCVREDHRRLGEAATPGRDRAAASIDLILAEAEELHIETEEILAVDDRALAQIVVHRGTSRTTAGGTFELRVGLVTAVRDGVATDIHVYDPEDRQPMIERFAALGGGQAALGNRPPERMWKSMIRAHAARDVDALRALHADDCTITDHRLLNWDPLRGWAAIRDWYVSSCAASQDLHITIDDVLACNDRAIAMRGRWRGTVDELGSAMSLDVASVAVVKDGRLVSYDQFAYEDVEGALTRFRELTMRPPERWGETYRRVWATRDVDAIMTLYAEDFELVDHRAMGWETVRGLDAARKLAESAAAISPDVEFVMDELLACDERVIAGRYAFRGSGVKAGGIDYRYGTVSVIEDGLWVRGEIFDVDDDAGMRAAFARLASRLGASPIERLFGQSIGAFNERDLDAHLAFHAPAYRLTDHRLIGWGETAGEAAFDVVRSSLEVSDDVRFDVDEVIACDAERVLAALGSWRGGGAHKASAWEVPVAFVAVGDEGLLLSLDLYEPGDRAAMLARFDALSRLHRCIAAYDVRDWDAVAALFDPDVTLVDRRGAGLGELRGADAVLQALRAFVASLPDARTTVPALLATRPGAALYRHVISGRDARCGEAEISMLIAVAAGERGFTHAEMFDEADEAIARARCDELTA